MIVIIGASGFIGTYLADELLHQGKQVCATGLNPRAKAYFQSRKVPFVNLDLSNPDDFAALPQKDVEAVVLLGGLVPANLGQGIYDPQKYIDVNISGTLRTLEYCRRCNAGKILYTSSHSDVAKLWDAPRAITEEDGPCINYTGDHAAYIITKITSVEFLEHFYQEYGLPYAAFRLPAIYGFGPHTEIYVDGRRIVTGFKVFIEKAMAGEPLEIWGDPSKGRDIVYVKDLVNMMIGAMNSNKAHGLYNVGTGVRTSLQKQAEGIVEVFSPPDHRSEIKYRPDKPNNLHTYLYDVSKAQKDLGYQVRYPYIEMLKDYKKEMEAKRFEHLIVREKKA